MDPQAIFEFLKNHLEVRLDQKWYQSSGETSYRVELWLTNPATNEPEKISYSEDFSI